MLCDGRSDENILPACTDNTVVRKFEMFKCCLKHGVVQR